MAPCGPLSLLSSSHSSCSSPGTPAPNPTLLPTQLSDLSLTDTSSRKPPRPRPWAQCPLPSPDRPLPAQLTQPLHLRIRSPSGQGLAWLMSQAASRGLRQRSQAGVAALGSLFRGEDAPTLHAGGQRAPTTFTHGADERLGSQGRGRGACLPQAESRSCPTGVSAGEPWPVPPTPQRWPEGLLCAGFGVRLWSSMGLSLLISLRAGKEGRHTESGPGTGHPPRAGIASSPATLEEGLPSPRMTA